MPALSKTPVDRVQLARYAGASGDFNPVHVDETYAKSLGMPSVYAPGMLIMGFLGQLVSDWARGAQLRRYSVKFSKIVWPGDTVVCKGRVTERWGDEGRYFADIKAQKIPKDMIELAAHILDSKEACFDPSTCCSAANGAMAYYQRYETDANSRTYKMIEDFAKQCVPFAPENPPPTEV